MPNARQNKHSNKEVFPHLKPKAQPPNFKPTKTSSTSASTSTSSSAPSKPSSRPFKPPSHSHLIDTFFSSHGLPSSQNSWTPPSPRTSSVFARGFEDGGKGYEALRRELEGDYSSDEGEWDLSGLPEVEGEGRDGSDFFGDDAGLGSHIQTYLPQASKLAKSHTTGSKDLASPSDHPTSLSTSLLTLPTKTNALPSTFLKNTAPTSSDPGYYGDDDGESVNSEAEDDCYLGWMFAFGEGEGGVKGEKEVEKELEKEVEGWLQAMGFDGAA